MILRPLAGFSHESREGLLDNRRVRWWWYLGVPVGIAVGAILAIWLRTSREDALTLQRGERVDAAFMHQLDPPTASTDPAPDGRFLLVAFGYTSCPDVCPITLLAIHEALERLGPSAARVVPVFVTVDPTRDTQVRLQQYTRTFDPRIRSISNPASVATTLRQFRVSAQRQRLGSGTSYNVDHTAVLYVLDPGRRVIAALPETSAKLATDIVTVLARTPELSASAAAK